MRVRLPFLLITAGVLSAAKASAEDGSVLDRPLLLARGSWEAELSGSIAQQPTNSQPGATTDLSFDIGLPWKLQAGLFLRDVQDFGSGNNALSTLMLNVQRGLGEHAAIRLDAGLAAGAQAFRNDGGLINSLPAAFGLGLPFRYRFDQQFALISGDSSARAFGSSTAAGDAVAFTPSEDLLTLSLYAGSCGVPLFLPRGGSAAFSAVCRQGWDGTVNLPLGVRLQPVSRVAVSVRSGFSLAFGANPAAPSNAPSSPFYIPFSVDVVVAPVRRLAVGLTVDTASQPQALMANRSLSLWTRLWL